MYWYAARVRHNTEKRIKMFLEEKEIEHFIPFHTVYREFNGKRVEKEAPLIPCWIFVHTDYATALSIPGEAGFAVSYIYNDETKRLRIIPDKQMEDFMFLLDLSDNIVRIPNNELRRGDRVRVIKGAFAGIEGELVRLKRHKRVVVRLEGLFSVATAYIPPGYLEMI
jgi:transcription antitermination factor NusG